MQQQQQVAAGAFDQRPDVRAAAATNDEVAFPVAEDEPVGRLLRSVLDRNHVLDPRRPEGDAPLRPAPDASRTQMHGELPRQTTLGLHEQRCVGRFVLDPHRRLIGEVEREPVGDLLGGQRSARRCSTTARNAGCCANFGGRGRLVRTCAIRSARTAL